MMPSSQTLQAIGARATVAIAALALIAGIGAGSNLGVSDGRETGIVLEKSWRSYELKRGFRC